MKNGLEIFEMLYNDEISKEECIIYTTDESEATENWQFLLRDKNGNFNLEEVVEKLLNKKYNFKVANQKKIEEMMTVIKKQARIEELREELDRLTKETDGVIIQ